MLSAAVYVLCWIFLLVGAAATIDVNGNDDNVAVVAAALNVSLYA